MPDPVPGIHHITVIASDPQANVDFYTGFLGLRLVKKTVNFDDPGTYHLYYGDDIGHPGTILTFFPWPNAYSGRPGAGEVITVAFTIPPDSLDHWLRLAKKRNISVTGPQNRATGEPYLSLQDPDGLPIELVAETHGSGHAIQGFHSAALALRNPEPTAELLTKSFGFRLLEQHGDRLRFKAESSGPGHFVDLIAQPGSTPRGAMGAGTVHHIAWRTANDETQKLWRRHLIEKGHNVTPVMDRQYFHSIYFREPGGVLFEIATDPPGFTFDETADQLGSGLKLPPWLEPERRAIEASLPPLETHAGTTRA